MCGTAFLPSDAMRRILLFATLLPLCVIAARGQDDSLRYINGLPIPEEDSASEVPVADQPPYNKLVAVNATTLPGGVREALDNDRHYEGWRDTIVYFDKNTGLYLVPVRRPDGIRIYGLNKNGKPATFREVTPPDER